MENNMNRRSALALTGMGMTTALAGMAAPAVAEEHPVQKVNRLAAELSEALVTWNDGEFHAVIHPAGSRSFAIAFGNTRALEEAKTAISRELTGLIEDQTAKFDDFGNAVTANDCDEPTDEDQEWWLASHEAEEAAMLALLAYVPLNAAETVAKGEAIKRNLDQQNLPDDGVDVLIASMIAAGGSVA